MKTIGILVLCVVGFFGLWGIGIAFGLFTVPWHSAQNVVDTKHQVIDKVVNGQNAIYNYEWFKQQSQDIKANLSKIEIAQQAVLDFEHISPKPWDFQDKQEHARLASIVQGLQSQQQTLVADYNARASMADRNIFLNGIVPSFYDVNKMVGGMSLGGQNEK